MTFQNGRHGLLDIRNTQSADWHKHLESRKQQNHPVYVEIDPSTTIVVELLLPMPVAVSSVAPGIAGDVEVRWIESHTRHYLRGGNPHFQDLLAALQESRVAGTGVWVTETPFSHEIIDVTSTPAIARITAPPRGIVSPLLRTVVTPQRAQDLFDLVSARTCDPSSPSPGCIPFLFVDDGCFARAHEMARLIRAEGIEPEKIWMYYTQPINDIPHPNHPYCKVGYAWHVAPVLTVQTSQGQDEWVIDPSLFSRPVSVAEWTRRQANRGTVYHSDADKYIYLPAERVDMTDSTYTQTNEKLAHWAKALSEQVKCAGPPPYPCRTAQQCLVIIDRTCHLILNRSTFGRGEINALLRQGSPATVESAFYVIVDGCTPDELGITSTTSTVTPTVIPVPHFPEMNVGSSGPPKLEAPSYLKRRQRITWTYWVRFTGTNAFLNEPTVKLDASINRVSAKADVYLRNRSNPYLMDGPIPNLSADLRVFQIKANDSKFGVAMGATSNDAPIFIQQVIDNLNGGTTAGQTFESDLPTDLQASKLELSDKVWIAATDTFVPVFNFAVAKVRYRDLSLPANDARVFFRLFLTSALEYDQSTTYRRGGQAGVAIPLLGVQDGQLVSIPFFASPRVDSQVNTLREQADPKNVRTLTADSTGAERIAYFGCWLDINQSAPQFPRQPLPADGPFPAHYRLSLQELVRYQQGRLIAEIAFDPASIPTGATPATSEQLAQRDLVILKSVPPRPEFAAPGTQFFPTRGRVGDIVTLYGRYFDAPNLRVLFREFEAQVVPGSVTRTSAQVYVPATDRTWGESGITVVTDGGAVTSVDEFEHLT
ncbi:protein-glutamine glutaminase family protein [Sorangium sp. So ce302]|uniref:protein-glutamine glutaminase family protein n=1 Tax=Sorangium sp. So ce302 TaxID=3133297 RepID=UPI003F61C26F